MELARRNTFRNSINRIRDFANNVADFEAATIIALKGRLDALQSAFEKLEAEHLKLVDEAIGEAAVDLHIAYYDEVVDIRLDTSIKIQERIQHLENEARRNAAAANAANQANNNNQNGNVNNNIQHAMAAAPEKPLERLKLSCFDGDYAKWTEWFSLFNSLVHTKNYDDAEKFHYMKTALSDSAAETISGWNVTGDNYQAAYDSLVALYNNPYRITMALLDQLFELEQLQIVNYDNLRMLINTVNRSTRQLAVAGCPVQHWDHFLVHFLLNRMPQSTLTNWETSRDLQAMPTLAEVVTFLERQARGNINLAQSTNGVHHQSNTGTIPKQNKPFLNGKLLSNGNGSKPPGDSLGVLCYVCGNSHPTFRCAVLKQMSLKDRRSRVSELGLCFVCLDRPLVSGHHAGSNDCRLGNCPICAQRHNRVLCDQTYAINSAMVQSIPSGQQQQQQIPMNASENQMVPAASAVQYNGAIDRMYANFWNRSISNTHTNQNSQ